MFSSIVSIFPLHRMVKREAIHQLNYIILSNNENFILHILQVRAAIKVKASVIICFTSSGRAARYLLYCYYFSFSVFLQQIYQSLFLDIFIVSLTLCYEFSGTFECRLIAKYRPTMPVLSVVIPRLKTNQLKWCFSGAFEVYPLLPSRTMRRYF